MFLLLVSMLFIIVVILIFWIAIQRFGLFSFRNLIIEYLFLYVMFAQVYFASFYFYLASINILPRSKSVSFFMGFLSEYNDFPMLGFFATSYSMIIFALLLVIFYDYFKDDKSTVNNKTNNKYGEESALWGLLLVSLFFEIVYLAIFSSKYPLMQTIFSNILSVTATRARFARAGLDSKVMLLMVSVVFPLFTYLSLEYYFKNKTTKKLFLFVLFSTLTTYSELLPLSKSGAALFLVSIVCLWSFLSGNKFELKKVILLTLIIFTIVFSIYLFTFKYENFREPIRAIFDRIFVTQYGSLPLHLKLYPEVFPFAQGKSATLLQYIGFQHIEVSRQVMEYIFPNQVWSNILGTANTHFIGEAYGDFGLIGIILSPVVVAMWIGYLMAMLQKTKGKIIENAFTFYMLWSMIASFNGGFFSGYVLNTRIPIIITFYLLIKLAVCIVKVPCAANSEVR